MNKISSKNVRKAQLKCLCGCGKELKEFSAYNRLIQVIAKAGWFVEILEAVSCSDNVVTFKIRVFTTKQSPHRIKEALIGDTLHKKFRRVIIHHNDCVEVSKINPDKYVTLKGKKLPMTEDSFLQYFASEDWTVALASL